MMQPSVPLQNLRMQKWVASVLLVLVVLKFAAYYFTASVAILTDAMESIVNLVAGVVGVYSLFITAQPCERNNSYGNGKAVFMSADVEGILIGATGICILYEATR